VGNDRPQGSPSRRRDRTTREAPRSPSSGGEGEAPMMVVDIPVPAVPGHIFEATLPDGAEILSVSPQVGIQSSLIQVPGSKAQAMLIISIMIDEKLKPRNKRRFAVVQTGQEFRWAEGSRYVGTTIVPVGTTPKVSTGLHVFELPQSAMISESLPEKKSN
jgi:hypothetical protein